MRGKFRLDGRKNVETTNGFPLIIYLTKDKQEKLIQTGFHSKKEHWDVKNALPSKKHPQYLDLLNYLELKKIKLKKLLENAKYQNVPLSYAETYLKGSDDSSFYKDGIELVKDMKRPYTVALNSFNRFYENYPYDMITKQTAIDYMNALLNTPVVYRLKGSKTITKTRKRSPNGVLSYMDSLTTVWNKLGKPNNPFNGIKPKAVPTKNKGFTDQDLQILRSNPYKRHFNSVAGGKYNYVNYLLLCFYLGGIDIVDLKNMRYDKHVSDGRVEFNRSKGGTNVFVSNLIFPQAWELLKLYDCYPYLVPLFMLKDYDSFIPNISRDFDKMKLKLGLSKKPYSKAPRYTFITRAQNLLIDERKVVQLVGHSQKTTHSIYKDEFPYHVIDKAHKKIIDF